ncbi:MAG: hypothetical protein IJE61_02935 [Bacteroidales bacterium]|nr:hypothetical protein [Bacteroidales bacterium]MBQ2918166.1 hypothetical protein [Bacteroidales bacterium]
MRKILILLTALVIPVITSAQAQINTKKVKIGDFTEKITKVVLTGNSFLDSSLKSDVANKWRVSPYEFCTLEEFEKLKYYDDYYFLLTVSGKFKKEDGPGIDLLTLVKGGNGASGGINGLLEVVSIPICPTEDPSGREFVFLPVLLDIIQSYTLESMEKDISGYTGLSNYSMNLHKAAGMEIIFSENDLSNEITREFRDLNFDSDMVITDEDTADGYVFELEPNTLVSYTVSPTTPQPGSYCYKMLINTQTNELYYYRRHKISKKFGPGFLAEDIKRINSYRGRK